MGNFTGNVHTSVNGECREIVHTLLTVQESYTLQWLYRNRTHLVNSHIFEVEFFNIHISIFYFVICLFSTVLWRIQPAHFVNLNSTHTLEGHVLCLRSTLLSPGVTFFIKLSHLHQCLYQDSLHNVIYINCIPWSSHGDTLSMILYSSLW